MAHLRQPTGRLLRSPAPSIPLSTRPNTTKEPSRYRAVPSNNCGTTAAFIINRSTRSARKPPLWPPCPQTGCADPRSPSDSSRNPGSKACSPWRNFLTLPSAILSSMFSGLPSRRACSRPISCSFSITSFGQCASSIATGAIAVACMATSCASSAGTSLLNPMSEPTLWLMCTYSAQ